ncbi:radical SAM protein [Candidatus Woesearchaeota archaeon]|nr:radical SAM protein [Candidatus Woesearchaeota archaeon]
MKRKTWFGRCIFLSWYCERGTCDFCFRSTIKHRIRHAASAKRSMASILTDAIIGKNLGWKIEFLTGGYGIFDFENIIEIAKHVSKIYQEKIWVNLGALNKDEMEKLKPYVEGVCASIETVEPELHNKVCPDKPIEPYSEMLKNALDLGFKTSMTIVIGLGEKKEDFDLLADFIEKHKLSQVTFYALKPVKGTPYTKSPDPEYYSWWIERTRKKFPEITIMAGLTPKRVDYVKNLLEAGADGLTKFPAVGQFNSEKARSIEEQAGEAGREFIGSLTELPEIDWEKEVENLEVDDELKQKIKIKLKQYLDKMRKEKG